MNKLIKYEKRKAELIARNLSSEEYEQGIKLICKELGL